MASINNGWTWRLDKKSSSQVLDAVEFHKTQYGGAGFEVNKVITLGSFGKPEFMIAGDSHALHYAFGLSSILKASSKSALGLFDHGCFIARDATRYVNSIEDKSCGEEYSKLLAALKGNDMPIILSYSWMGYRNIIGLKNSKPRIFASNEPYVEYLLDELDKFRADIGLDRKLVIIGQVPGTGPGGSAIDCILRPMLSMSYCASKFSYPEERSAGYWVNKQLKQYADKNELIFIDPQSIFCSDGICQSIIDDKVMYSDALHLSKDGSTKAVGRIFQLMKQSSLIK